MSQLVTVDINLGQGRMRILEEDLSRRRQRVPTPYVRSTPQQSSQMPSLNLQRSQSAEQQRSPGTSSVKQPLTDSTVKDIFNQQQLFLLLHARKCIRTETGSQCTLRHCSSTKLLLSHFGTCTPGKPCQFRNCFSSREILAHWKNCTKDAACNTCSVLKQASDTRHQQAGTSTLKRDLEGLLLSGNDSDIKFEVQGQIFKAHRVIIKSRSPVFAAMFEHNMQENISGIVKVNDCDPGTFRNFLQCIYTGRVKNLTFSDATNLYRVADKYDLVELKDICVNLMEEKLSVDTACDVLLLADMHNDVMLKYFALEFLVSNMKKVLHTSVWRPFMEQNSALAAMILERAFMSVIYV